MIDKTRPRALTVAAVARLKPGRKRREVLDSTPGLYLIIQPSGAKSWALRYKRNSKRFKLTLGTCDTSGKELEGEPAIGGHLTLPAARRLATEVHRQLALGRDPVQERKAGKIAASVVKVSPSGFAAAAQDYVEQHCRDKKGNRTWWKIGLVLGLDYQRDEECYSPTIIKNSLAYLWRDKPVSEITDADVFAVADAAAVAAIPGRRAKTKGRSDAREREMINALSGMFKWLRKRKLVAALPTAGLERPPSGKGERVLTSDELRRLWAACDDGPFGRVVKLLMLTGQRTGEVAGMRWSELGEDAWTIPAERAKNKREHAVPLSKAAVALIPSNQGGDLVFTTTGSTPISGFSKAKARLDARLKFDEDWQLRDLRRTVVTGMAELGVQPHIIEAVVNHVSGHKGGIAGIYNKAEYAEPKRKALERWAAHVLAVVKGQEEKTVTEFARVRA